MKTFVAVFTGAPDAMARFQSLPQAERQKLESEGMRAWGQWMERHRDALVDDGGPLGKTKRVTAEGVADVRNQIGAYTVVRAETHEAAAQMFVGHPHFMIFPGDGVDVMERLPIPGR
jgi:leucyl aminopeptidase (aminopeptidase T)